MSVVENSGEKKEGKPYSLLKIVCIKIFDMLSLPGISKFGLLTLWTLL